MWCESVLCPYCWMASQCIWLSRSSSAQQMMAVCLLFSFRQLWVKPLNVCMQVFAYVHFYSSGACLGVGLLGHSGSVSLWGTAKLCSWHTAIYIPTSNEWGFCLLFKNVNLKNLALTMGVQSHLQFALSLAHYPRCWQSLSAIIWFGLARMSSMPMWDLLS